MNKKKKNDVWNLIFSAFLVTAFMICSTFFIGMISESFAQDTVKRTLLTALVFVLFGLILFYATRVGDGKQVVRFSAATLILMVLPAIYVILASVISGMPFYDKLSQHGEIANIAAVVLGYGIPYTFLSGYELEKRQEAEETSDDKTAETDSTQTAEEESISTEDKEETEESDTSYDEPEETEGSEADTAEDTEE